MRYKAMIQFIVLTAGLVLLLTNCAPRVVRNDRGLASRQESIVEPQIYRDFFDKLSQSLFLEANAI